jgi:hypothetical protein
MDQRNYGSYNRYNRTANAYKYEQSPALREEEEYSRGYRVIKRRRTVKVQRKIAIEHRKEKGIRMPKPVYILAAVFFLGAFGLQLSVSAVHVKKIAVQKLESEVKILRESNREGQAALSALRDIEEIRIAAEKIGMGPPKPHQIKYIDVPRESYAKAKGSAEENTNADSAINVIAEFFKGD